VRFGVVLFTSDRGITPARAAQAAEEHGFATFAVPEHTHIPTARTSAHPGTGDASLPDDRYLRTLDPWVALATAASVTSRIRLGTAVALPLEHDPITMAKAVASLDHLSGGRVWLGAGFGWNREELADHGVDPTTRRTALRESLEAMRRLWEDEVATYEGEHVRFGPSWAWPKPVQARVPVLLGAAGTERNLRWVARTADGWITTPIEQDVEGSIKLLCDLWADEGRAGRPEVVVLDHRVDEGRVQRWSELGVTEVLVGLPDRDEADVVAHIARQGEQAARLA
jgi:probable F420-dependent oxidoreductase